MDLLTVFEKGNYSEVINNWENNQFQISNDPNSAFIVAAAHFRLGNLEKAREICESIDGPFSTNAAFLSMYAAILRRSNLLTRAEEVFLRALEISPNSKEISNNYSNLLIDQEKFDDAIKILSKILKNHPEYTDAKLNLERAEAIKKEKQQQEIKSIPQPENDDNLGDPLEQAFNVEEVNRLGGKIGSVTATVGDILLPDDAKNIEDAELEMLRLATDQIKDKQFRGALDLLSSLREKVGTYSSLYKASSDAMIGLEKYKDAEIFALLAYINDENSVANYINLASLAAMRKDQLMAKAWLSKAEKLDKNNDSVVQCKNLLFPEGRSREEDEPFSFFVRKN